MALTQQGKPTPKLKTLTYAEALFEAMIYRFYQDPTMVAFGEENRDWGGAFGVYRGLTEALPYHRLFNTSISEGAIVGAGTGYALCGGRVVAELMYADFMGRAGDEIFNQMAKWQSMSGGLLEMPLVLRVSVGAKYGAQHSQDWSAMVAHVPGLKVFFPATPYDAKGMLNLALAGSDPVVFFESQRLYPETEILVEGGVPKDYYEVPLGEPAVRRKGSDITIITIGATLYRALDAAKVLQDKYGLSAEVIDVRFLNPLNYGPAGRVGQEDGQGRHRQRRHRARLVCAHHRQQPDAAGLRLPRRPAGRRRLAQLDHAGGRVGGHVLPDQGVDPGHDPRAHPAAARACGEHAPRDGGDPDAQQAGCLNHDS